MKGTLFSADFVQDSNDNLRLLEINTDTGFYTSAISHFDYTGLHNIISSSNIVNLHVISKGFQHEFVTSLSQSIASEGVITGFTNTVEEDYTIYPTAVTDADDKFILRVAYDESTVFDSVYCKKSNEITRLFLNNQDVDSVAEAFHTSSTSGQFINTLAKRTNGDNIPDFVVKDATELGNGVAFVKAAGSEEADVDNLINSLPEAAFITNFYNTSGTTQKSYRSYNVVYGADLELVNIANIEIPALFDKPTSLTLSGSIVDDKHFYEFSTNYPFFQPKDGYGGIFEEESITGIDGNAVPVISASVGSSYQSYFISGSPDTDLVRAFGEWSHEGSTVPSGSYITSSVLTNSITSTLYKKLVSNITVAGDHSIRMSGNQHLLVYDSGSNELKYKEAYQIDEVSDYLVKLDGSTADIVSNNIEILEDEHKVYLLDMEEVDTYIVNEGGINFKVVAHNACFPAGTKINLANGETQLIETFTGGEDVQTYDTTKKEFSTARVEKLKSSTQTDLLEITTETGEVIKCTKGHKMYTPNGWRDAHELRVGEDLMMNSLGNLTAITSIVTHEGEFEVYHLMNVGSEHTYFADNLLVHNYSRAGACFVDGTEVTLSSGDVKNIEDVKQGDEVLTLNEATGEQEGKLVYGIMTPKHNDIVKYTLEDGTEVSSTYDHPYFVDGLELKSLNPVKTNSLYNIGVEVGEIKIGDILIKADGSKSAIVTIDAGLLDADIQTTIIRVEDNHNFYANGILVHNK